MKRGERSKEIEEKGERKKKREEREKIYNLVNV